jgi:hypothetical protein
MQVAQSPAHYINSSKGCPSITESFRLGFFSTVRHRRGIASGATLLLVSRHVLAGLSHVYKFIFYEH